MRKYFIFIFIFFFCCSIIQAQQYLVRYDLVKDQISYYKIGKKNDTTKVSQVSPKNNKRVALQIDNFNPFYWKAKVSPYKRPVAEENGSIGKLGLFGFLTKGLGSMIPKNFPSLDIPGFLTRGNAETPEDKLMVSYTQFNKYYSELSSLTKKYTELDEVALKLTGLKYETKLTEEEIKAAARATLQTIFSNTSMGADDFVRAGRDMDNRYSIVKDSMLILKNDIQKLSTQVDSALRISKDQTVKDLVDETKKGMNLVDSLSLKTNGSSIFSDRVNKVGQLYVEIMETSFTYKYAVNSSPEITDLKMEIYPRMDAESKDTIIKYFPVEARTLKMRNSVGVCFSHFPANYRSYYVKADTTIGKQTGNLFTPLLATYVHFYSSGRSNLKWGGTLGFGIPLFGEDKEIHFLLGISAIVGRSEMVIINFGLAGAKVNKLKNGYSIGDKVQVQDMNSLTRTVYDAGVFFSVSLNFGSLQQKK